MVKGLIKKKKNKHGKILKIQNKKIN